jgi:hypothetical protein
MCGLDFFNRCFNDHTACLVCFPSYRNLSSRKDRFASAENYPNPNPEYTRPHPT